MDGDEKIINIRNIMIKENRLKCPQRNATKLKYRETNKNVLNVGFVIMFMFIFECYFVFFHKVYD